MNRSLYEPPRDWALTGLIILAIAALLVDALQSGGNLLFETQGSPASQKGQCVYHVVKDGVPLGTVFFSEPQAIGQIVSPLIETSKTARSDLLEAVPCKSVIRLCGDPPEAAVEKMSGRHLLCAQSRIDINRADETDMAAAPGIGIALARNIVHHRESVGPFPSTDALLAVGGIGARKLRKLKPYVEVAPSLHVDRPQHVQTRGSLLDPHGGVTK